MVDIIKLEDLTLDEVKSRIKSLDPAFAENNLSFTRADTIKSPNHSEATDIFIETLIINSASRYIYPLFSRTIKTLCIVYRYKILNKAVIEFFTTCRIKSCFTNDVVDCKLNTVTRVAFFI